MHQLQESVGRLQDGQECFEASYHHIKKSNDGLVKKIFMLEDIIKKMEVSNIENARESERRLRETEQKLQLEKLKSKDYAIRILELESDNATLLEKFDQLNCHVPNDCGEPLIEPRHNEDMSCFDTEREVRCPAFDCPCPLKRLILILGFCEQFFPLGQIRDRLWMPSSR